MSHGVLKLRGSYVREVEGWYEVVEPYPLYILTLSYIYIN